MSIDRGMDKEGVVYTHTEYYSAIRKNKAMWHTYTHTHTHTHTEYYSAIRKNKAMCCTHTHTHTYTQLLSHKKE